MVVHFVYQVFALYKSVEGINNLYYLSIICMIYIRKHVLSTLYLTLLGRVHHATTAPYVRTRLSGTLYASLSTVSGHLTRCIPKQILSSKGGHVWLVIAHIPSFILTWMTNNLCKKYVLMCHSTGIADTNKNSHFLAQFPQCIYQRWFQPSIIEPLKMLTVA